MSPVAEGLQRISDLPGAELPIERCRWAEDQRAANFHLWLLLAEMCGRVELDGIGGFTQRGEPSDWLRLADVDSASIDAVVRRIERAHPGWRLDGGDASTAIERLDVHFATAQERRRREG